MARSKIGLKILLLILIFSFAVPTSANPWWKIAKLSRYNSPAVDIYIEDAYYLDADRDGYQDDTYAHIRLDFSGALRYDFNYKLILTLPSGLTFEFDWTIGSWEWDVEIGTTMFDTALEPGWYQLVVKIGLYTGGLTYTEDSHDFDPPGGTSNTRPLATYRILS